MYVGPTLANIGEQQASLLAFVARNRQAFIEPHIQPSTVDFGAKHVSRTNQRGKPDSAIWRAPIRRVHLLKIIRLHQTKHRSASSGERERPLRRTALLGHRHPQRQARGCDGSNFYGLSFPDAVQVRLYGSGIRRVPPDRPPAQFLCEIDREHVQSGLRCALASVPIRSSVGQLFNPLPRKLLRFAHRRIRNLLPRFPCG